MLPGLRTEEVTSASEWWNFLVIIIVVLVIVINRDGGKFPKPTEYEVQFDVNSFGINNNLNNTVLITN